MIDYLWELREERMTYGFSILANGWMNDDTIQVEEEILWERCHKVRHGWAFSFLS